MSSHVKTIIDFLSYEGSLTNDPQDQIKLKRSVEESAASEVFRKLIQIPDSTIDLSITLPDTVTDYLIINTDQSITIKLNGSSDIITLNPKSTGIKTPVFFMRGIINSITISNNSGFAANVDIISIQI